MNVLGNGFLMIAHEFVDRIHNRLERRYWSKAIMLTVTVLRFAEIQRRGGVKRERTQADCTLDEYGEEAGMNRNLVAELLGIMKEKGLVTTEELRHGTRVQLVGAMPSDAQTTESSPAVTAPSAPKSAPKRRPKSTEVDDEYLAEMRAIYTNIDVDREATKARGWCLSNNRDFNKRCFGNWLIKAESRRGPDITGERECPLYDGRVE